MQSQIGQKENENKKLYNEIQNKSINTNIKGGRLFLNVLNNDNNKSNSNNNYTNKFNANSSLGREPTGDIGKYKNLLDKLNDYEERENKYKNEIIKLRTQLKNKEKSKIKNNLNDFESNFIEDEK